MIPNTSYHGDCLAIMEAWPDRCVDLVMTSPPYEDCRTYGIDFNLKGQDWVDWLVPRIAQMARICKGLVCVVCEGKTRQYRYSATPILLMADLHRAGFNLRKPAIFHRIGIPGSGSFDWLRSDYEFCVCITPPGRLPWSDNKAMGHPPKWAPGGDMSNRIKDGTRNQWGGTRKNGRHRKSGGEGTETYERPSHVFADKLHTKTMPDGSSETQGYSVPVKANPGNTIKATYTADEVAELLAEAGDVTHHKVGGGLMGSFLAHENEAPYPETLPEFFIRSFCPPDGIVCDPFSGSGATAKVALKHSRRYVAIDVRESQVELTNRRVQEAA